MRKISYTNIKTLKDHWTIRERTADSHDMGTIRDIGTYHSRSAALAVLWKLRAESADTANLRLVKRRLVTAVERSWRAATQAKRIANALIVYANDHAESTPLGFKKVDYEAILDFAQEIMDGKR